jgi:hypothetical protein
MDRREVYNYERKVAIAERARREIHEDQIVSFDSGSTTGGRQAGTGHARRPREPRRLPVSYEHMVVTESAGPNGRLDN